MIFLKIGTLSFRHSFNKHGWITSWVHEPGPSWGCNEDRWKPHSLEELFHREKDKSTSKCNTEWSLHEVGYGSSWEKHSTRCGWFREDFLEEMLESVKDVKDGWHWMAEGVGREKQDMGKGSPARDKTGGTTEESNLGGGVIGWAWFVKTLQYHG